MKYLITLILLNQFIFCGNDKKKGKSSQENKKQLLMVERWWKPNDSTKNNVAKVYEKMLFDDSKNLIVYASISKDACNVTDSVRFTYNGSNQLVEMVEYLPTDSLIGECITTFKESFRIKLTYYENGNFQRVDTLVRVASIYLPPRDFGMFKDPFRLLAKEFEEIQFTIQHSDDSLITFDPNKPGIKVKKYFSNFIPGLFVQYGLAPDAFLDSMHTFQTDNRILKDQFFFKGINTTRSYEYIGERISKIKISIDQNKELTRYEEGFTYKLQ